MIWYKFDGFDKSQDTCMGSDAAELVSLWEQQHANGTALGTHIAAGWVCAVHEAEQKLWACHGLACWYLLHDSQMQCMAAA